MAASTLFLVALAAAAVNAGEIITSPPITNWGQWGELERCPEGALVQGFQLKTEPSRGPLIDDTALNGVRFYCGHPLNPNTTIITSTVGSWGSWGNVYSCGTTGFIVGLQLRVEANGVDDETATNNARFICSNMEPPNNYIEGDGLGFGIWRGSVSCPVNQGFCGIQTQIQPDRGALLDDTSMNNLSAECCPLPSQV